MTGEKNQKGGTRRPSRLLPVWLYLSWLIAIVGIFIDNKILAVTSGILAVLATGLKLSMKYLGVTVGGGAFIAYCIVGFAIAVWLLFAPFLLLFRGLDSPILGLEHSFLVDHDSICTTGLATARVTEVMPRDRSAVGWLVNDLRYHGLSIPNIPTHNRIAHCRTIAGWRAGIAIFWMLTMWPAAAMTAEETIYDLRGPRPK